MLLTPVDRPRTVSRADSHVLGALAQKGRWSVHLPDDEAWLSEIEGVGGNPRKRLTEMTRRGSLAHLAAGSWVVLPDGARSPASAYSPEMLLSAVMNAQRQQWYVGCISAMAVLQLTDETSDVMVVVTRGPKQLRLSKIAGRAIRIVNVRREDNWEGIDRIRLRGRTFTYRSGVERTLLDTLEYPRLCGPPELWVRAWERALHEERVMMPILTDLAETRSHAVQARLAFWLAETGHPRDARYVLAMSKTRLTGRVFLDSSQTYAGQWPRDPATGLIVNVPRKAIDGWLTYGK